MEKKTSSSAASILHELGMDCDTVTALSILEKYRDSTLPVSLTELYGPAVAKIVNGVIKVDKLQTDSKTILEAQNIRNMLFALCDDIRVIFIKLAEKLHTLQVLDTFPENEQKKIARECLDIYAPLANRLGISWIKNELEDLSLKVLNPETYQQIKKLVAEKREQRKQSLQLMQETIVNKAKMAGINITIKSRAKHFYSVYMKMRKRGVSAEKIYDLSGVRVICDTVDSCYTLLGIIHRLWEPINGGFKDYIAKPKPNGYRSLHTTVIFEKDSDSLDESSEQSSSELRSGEEGRLLEIQIRTEEMHQIAEYGVASHWLYKKGSSRDIVQAQDIGVINKLKDWKQNETLSGQEASHDADTGEFSHSWLEEIKQDILGKNVFVFTPQGKVIKLPAGATPLDFAYQVHTAVGEHCIGAKANGKIIPLNSQLQNTQIVEILTSPSAHPNIKWLEMAKSAKARSKIRSWLEKNDEFYSIDKIPETKKKPASETPIVSPGFDKQYPADGSNVSPVQMLVKPLSSILQVSIEDEKNLLVRFARCCNPVTGDNIIGYVSRGRGIIIHRENCKSLCHNPEFDKRKIDASWEKSSSALVKRFKVEAKLTANLFSEIESAIRKRQGHLIEGRLEKTASSRLSGNFTMQLTNADDLKPVMKNIRGIPGILGIQTVN